MRHYVKHIVFLLSLIAFANTPVLWADDVEKVKQQADQAYADGARDRARTLYAKVLELDPVDSRATYRLAALQPKGSLRAVRLFRAYVQLEPDDPWGYMALGDALAASGDLQRARSAYDGAFSISPKETDAFVGLGRLLTSAERADEAINVYQRWTLAQPDNPQAWLELGKSQQRSRHYLESANSLANAYNLKAGQDTERLLRRSLYQVAPTVQPLLGFTRDSDDVEIERSGVLGDWQFTNRSRLGFRMQRLHIGDPFDKGEADEFGLTYRWQPKQTMRIIGGAGRTLLEPADRSVTTYHLRARFDTPQAGPAGELRIDHYPLLSSPVVLREPVEVSEFRGMYELPVRGRTRARFRLRQGSLDSDVDHNTRTGYDMALVYRTHPTVEWMANYQQLGYDNESSAGYSSPERLQTIEFGTYAELYDYWPLTIVVDAAIGVQRRDDHGEPSRGWGDSIRFWGQLSWDLQPDLRLDVEIEASNSQDPATGVAASTEWSYSAIMLSLRYAVDVKGAHQFVAENNRSDI